MKKKIIVTGGAGFIGSHLVEKLIKLNFSVVVIDNLSNGKKENLKKIIKKIKFLNFDISQKGNWQKHFKNAFCVYHLAALADIVPSINYPENYYSSNVTGTLNVLETMRKFNVKKIIYSASSSCYGIPKEYPTSEKAKCDPKYPYALTKKLGEDLVLHWSDIYKLKAISLRFFNVYGPRARTSGNYGAMFGVFLAQKVNGLPLTVVGDGKQRRDFVYIFDVIKALVKCLNIKNKKSIINIGSGKAVSINYICKLIGGKKVFIPKRPGEPDKTWSNIKLAKKILNWEPTIAIDEGVKNLLKNINYWEKSPIWNKENIKDATRDWFKYLK